MFQAAHILTRAANQSSLAVLFALITLATPAFAQETREDDLAAQQAEKATRLRPYEPTLLERRIESVERFDGILFGAPNGAYAFVGSVFEGGGLAAGPGYRTRYKDTGMVDAHAAWSVKNYKAADANVKLPAFANDRVQFETRANWIDAPDVAFYGLGNNTREHVRVGYDYRSTTLGFSARLQAARYFAVGGGLDAIQIESTPVVPGMPLLSADPNYRRSRLFAEFDWRTSPGYTTRGGLYRLDWSDYQQTNAGPYSFRRVDAEVQQFVPILRENWVIAMRALASTTDTASGEAVPYFLMPDLGGSHTLRGYSAWRFRDRSRLLLTGEYRWTAGSFVDMALFVDTGKVAPRAQDLDLHGLTTTYGIGMSFHTPLATVMRMELARTTEGPSLVFSFSPSF